jgi:hypothetical protein
VLKENITPFLVSTEALDLSHNYLNKDSASSIALILENGHLTELNLCDNPLTDEFN